MMHKILPRVLIICVAFLLTALGLEIAVRIGGEVDADGQFTFRNHILPPYALPIDKLRSRMEKYLEVQDQTTLIPDPATGWIYRPNSTRQNGDFTINGSSLRSVREYILQPAHDTLRIAIFGDSFVAGDEVKDDEVWGHALERLLVQTGTKAEVINFGVGGYGMDQALLRWRSAGKDYAPDIVIFGFQPENLDRNVNLFRLLYTQGEIVFSKPRFVLDEGTLSPINFPAMPPLEMMQAFETFHSHPLAEHEAYYRGRGHSSPLSNISRLAGLANAVFNQLDPIATPGNRYGPESERGKLAKAIVDAFAADVAATGSKFVIVHLPRKDHLAAFHEGKRAPYRFLLDYFQEAYRFINPEEFLGPEYADDAYHQPNWHYGPEINRKIAQAVAAEILACTSNGSCAISRLQQVGDVED